MFQPATSLPRCWTAFTRKTRGLRLERKRKKVAGPLKLSKFAFLFEQITVVYFKRKMFKGKKSNLIIYIDDSLKLHLTQLLNVLKDSILHMICFYQFLHSILNILYKNLVNKEKNTNLNWCRILPSRVGPRISVTTRTITTWWEDLEATGGHWHSTQFQPASRKSILDIRLGRGKISQ